MNGSDALSALAQNAGFNRGLRRARVTASTDCLTRYRSEMSMEDLTNPDNAEARRLKADSIEERKAWKFFGPYLSERQWSTVREDYSENSDSWGFFPHEHARSRAYRWGEDGLLGISDERARMCLALALWNGKDPILKERLYGVTGPEGNHGEDCKELYYYLDSSPTHSYLRGLYKYPQAEYPYKKLAEETRRRSKADPEFEITDSGVFNGNHYWDCDVQYAKFDKDDILMTVTVTNRSDKNYEQIHVLPTLWYRNMWRWGQVHDGYQPDEGENATPLLRAVSKPDDHVQCVYAQHNEFETDFVLYAGSAQVNGDGEVSAPEVWFCDNETNKQALFGGNNVTPYPKDAFHRKLINGDNGAINPDRMGTKCTVHYSAKLAPGSSVVLRLRLRARTDDADGEAANVSQTSAQKLVSRALFDAAVEQRKSETDEYYESIQLHKMSDDMALIQRQAYAGLLWSKQFFYYIVEDWFAGDQGSRAKPSANRMRGRNREWRHFYAADVLSMPDKWEYPWFATWDTAFHMIPFSEIDPDFSKEQLQLFLEERYMKFDGQLPAYEFDLSDVNPPVHPFAVWRVFKNSRVGTQRDWTFLKTCFHKLVINFTWWVNRKDKDGQNIFGGGFLGLDNIGVFDRSAPVPGGGTLEQADGTSWMAMYTTLMLDISLELAAHDPVYEEMAGKFFSHLILMIDAMNSGDKKLWSEEDGFYYDALLTPGGHRIPIKLRSLVGLVPLFAALVVERDVLKRLPTFRKKVSWFLQTRSDLRSNLRFMGPGKSSCEELSEIDFKKLFVDDVALGEHKDSHLLDAHFLLSIPNKAQLRRLLEHMLDERKFLSPFGIRSMSREYEHKPFHFECNGQHLEVRYCPAESDSYMFGGNSNWRGPIWFPMNYLIIHSLERLDYFYGDSFKVAFPTGSNNMLTLKQVSVELSRRLVKLFEKDQDKKRPTHGNEASRYAGCEHWRDLVLYYEYFNPETGRGVGASHQTGWTGLVASIVAKVAEADDLKS